MNQVWVVTCLHLKMEEKEESGPGQEPGGPITGCHLTKNQGSRPELIFSLVSCCGGAVLQGLMLFTLAAAPQVSRLSLASVQSRLINPSGMSCERKEAKQLHEAGGARSGPRHLGLTTRCGGSDARGFQIKNVVQTKGRHLVGV